MNPQQSSALNFNQVIQDFLNLLLDEGGMTNVSADVRAQMFNDLKVRFDQKIFAAIISRLEDQQVTEFRKLIEGQAGGEDMEKFIEKNIPDAQDLFARVFMTFRNEYLGLE